MKIIFLVFCAVCSFVNGDKLLALQSFGAGYPSFHVIKVNNDGSLSCGTYKCRNPPHYCKIESKSDDKIVTLVSTIECKDRNMKSTDRWTLKQKNPKPGVKINILTEADVLGKINNKKNVEGGSGPMVMDGMSMDPNNFFSGNFMKGMNMGKK